MLTIRGLLVAAGLALALAAPHAPVQAQASVARWRGGGNEQLIDQAVRRYGYRPNRLTDAQVRAINDAWTELVGPGTRRAPLNRAQATAIVYMALVEPYDRGGRDGYGTPGGGYDDGGYGNGGGYGSGGGGGYGNGGGIGGGRPGSWGAECGQLEADAYRLGTLVSAPERNAGLFIAEPEKGRARTLARQIQENAVQCRAIDAADRAAEVLRALSEALPERSDVEMRVNALKAALQQGTSGRPRW